MKKLNQSEHPALEMTRKATEPQELLSVEEEHRSGRKHINRRTFVLEPPYKELYHSKNELMHLCNRH